MIGGNPDTALQFPVLRFCYGNGQLVGARCRLEAAGVAGEGVGDFVGSPSVHDFRNGLQVAVAPAGKGDVLNLISLKIELYFHWADALRVVFVFHIVGISLRGRKGRFLNVVMIPHLAVFFIYNNKCKLL